MPTPLLIIQLYLGIAIVFSIINIYLTFHAGYLRDIRKIE